ncbi:MAG: tyrosine-type recombinase/integrase [Candidatus Riflebacteria bacterium]|nr:tyrosine-type recombinase/integrase [Candidatus Riflebacteria bacterium]
MVTHLQSPFDVVVKLRYGCGLRLFECLGLCVQCFNFDAGILTVHDGKNIKGRTVSLPLKIISEIKTRLKILKFIHRQDLESNYAGVFLVDLLGKKYPNAAKEFIWRWFFPDVQLTHVPETGEFRRHFFVDSQWVIEI